MGEVIALAAGQARPPAEVDGALENDESHLPELVWPEDNPDAEIIWAATNFLAAQMAWNEGPDSTSDRCIDRLKGLVDRWEASLAKVEAQTPAGLAMQMRVDFVTTSCAPWAASAMLGDGPDDEQLASLDNHNHLHWLYIKNLDAIAAAQRAPLETAPCPAPRPGPSKPKGGR